MEHLIRFRREHLKDEQVKGVLLKSRQVSAASRDQWLYEDQRHHGAHLHYIHGLLNIKRRFYVQETLLKNTILEVGQGYLNEFINFVKICGIVINILLTSLFCFRPKLWAFLLLPLMAVSWYHRRHNMNIKTNLLTFFEEIQKMDRLFRSNSAALTRS